MEFSFEGIGQVAATFMVNGDIQTGMAVALTADSTVGLGKAGDAPCGMGDEPLHHELRDQHVSCLLCHKKLHQCKLSETLCLQSAARKSLSAFPSGRLHLRLSALGYQGEPPLP